MVLLIILLFVASIMVWATTVSGKIVLGCVVLSIGLLVLSWLLDMVVLVKVAKILLIVMVITIVLGIFISIIRA